MPEHDSGQVRHATSAPPSSHGLPPPPSDTVPKSGGSVAPSTSSTRHRKLLRDTWVTQVQEQFDDPSTGLKDRILRLVNQHHPGKPTGEYRWYYGSYNLSVAYNFHDESVGASIAIFRVPIPGLVAFAEEKTRAEVATMLYVAEHTTIRVPRVYHWGTAGENPTGLDLPFIVMEFIPHSYDMGALWEDPGLVQRPELKANMNLVKEHLFRQLAKVHIQLYQLQAPHISALHVVDGRGVPGGAPKPFLLNNQITSYRVPEAAFTQEISETISTSREWHVSVANMYIAGLIYDTDEVKNIREKFVARYLYRQLAKKRILPQSPDDKRTKGEGSKEFFRLWCDDLRPHNVLCNEQGDLQGVIDWEFVYFAPESYVYDPPYWLFIDRDPECFQNDEGSDQEEEVVSERGKIDDNKAHAHYEVSNDSNGGPKSNRLDFEMGEEFENNRRILMRVLQQEERKLCYERRKKSVTNDIQSHDQSDGVAEQLSGLRIQDEQAMPTPLYDGMRKRWEQQRNEFVWNFTYRWDRDEFDAWYWDELDREHSGKWGDYRDRLDLLPQHVKDLMDWFVLRRVEERDEWDPKELMEAVLSQMDGKGPLVAGTQAGPSNTK